MASAHFTSTSTSRREEPAAPQVTELPDSIILSGLSVRLLVGVDGWERVQPQPVSIDVRVHTDVSQAGQSDHLPYSIHYGILTKELEKHCAGARYRSLEALAEGLAKVCIFVCKAPRVTLKVEKPRSLLHARSAGVQITRTAQDFIKPSSSSSEQAWPETPSADMLNSLRLSPQSHWATKDVVLVNDLEISTILGVNPWERVDKQIVRINLVVFSGLERLRQASLLSAKPGRAVPAPPVDVVTRPQNYRTIVRSITAHVENSNYKTVESLATSIAMVAIGENRVERIKVRVDKPSAIMFAECAGVEVERDRDFFEKQSVASGRASSTSVQTSVPRSTQSAAKPNGFALPIEREEPHLKDGEWHVVAIALGSNLGDRFANLENAVRLLSENENCKLVDTSFLYETTPMYYEDQPKFLNAACRIATRLTPHQLLALTQSIETQLGRDKRGVPLKGPRMVDLDILFYDRLELSTSDLTLPHPGIPERDFVLRPLCDILPDYRHPQNSRTVSQLLSILTHSEGYVASDTRRVMNVPASRAMTWSWGERTLIMGVINATPDSFSDGGDNLSAQAAVQTALSMVEEGADMLDVGGMSTSPAAPEVSAKEEEDRVVPVIAAIRAAGITVPVSIDTFRASVAEAAISAGANIINDVSAGLRDAKIFDVARNRAVPIVLMHMRGDSQTMTSAANTSYHESDVVGGVKRELEARMEAALRAGVRRWNVILDPGIGFAKDKDGNVELLRGLHGFTSGHIQSGSRASSPPPPAPVSLPSEDAVVGREGREGEGEQQSSPSALDLAPHASLAHLPMLLGVSRKRFVGTLTGRKEPKDRIYGTAAACTAGILAGVDILRVHDVGQMCDVAKVADAIARRRN
ncbi:Dihydropteroate synthase [Acaromyces ingoldii]|uniref:Dihydropteroate synthase n=1 Tax=Acaromyces ingoldii TaxID=215250 RepID=A0A316YMS3_9BASI|nr:Dihydropteroate synthase [Acaromyces ingoldii]PWN90850.1 Dihydropteroate synthase [Acaromyces ingoldii]